MVSYQQNIFNRLLYNYFVLFINILTNTFLNHLLNTTKRNENIKVNLFFLIF